MRLYFLRFYFIFSLEKQFILFFTKTFILFWINVDPVKKERIDVVKWKLNLE